MQLTLPDQFLELFDKVSQPEIEARIRLAAQFYASGKVGVAKAAELAGMSRREFEKWLYQHSIHIPWSDEDVAQEIATANRLKSQ